MVSFIARTGFRKEGKLIRQYSAYTGGTHYVVMCGDEEYHCEEYQGQLVEAIDWRERGDYDVNF